MPLSASVRRQVLAMTTLFTLLLATGLGCSGGGSTASGNAGGGGVPLATATTATGAFAFEVPAGPQGSALGLRAREGVGPATIHVAGTVALEGPKAATVEIYQEGAHYRVRALLDDGTVLLADSTLPEADRRSALGLADGPHPEGQYQWVWVTPVSTLLAVYRDAHPTETVGSELAADVKRYLGLGEKAWINRPFASVSPSRFSPAAFLREAQAAGQDLVGFSRTLIAEIEAGGVHAFQEPSSARSLSSRGVDLVESQGVEAKVAESFGTKLLKSIGSGALKGGGKGLLKWGASSLGIGQGTKALLRQMSQQLTNIQNQLAQIEQGVGELATSNLQQTVQANDIAPVQNFLINTLATNVTAATSGDSYRPFLPTPYWAVTGQALFGSLSVQAATGYAQDLADNCLGIDITGTVAQENLVTALIEQQARPYGSLSQPSAFYYDFHNDVLTTPGLQAIGSYYVGSLANAALMLSESGHRTFVGDVQAPASDVLDVHVRLNGSPAGNQQSPGGGYAENGILALGTRMSQQVPQALLGGESPIPGVWGSPVDVFTASGTPGAMWVASGIEVTGKGYDSGQNIRNISKFSIGGWNNWYLPTTTDVENLYARAAALAAVDNPQMPTNQRIPYGLHKMGLISDANYTSGMTIVQVYNSLYQKSFTNSNGWKSNVPNCYSYRSDNSNNYDDGIHPVENDLGAVTDFVLQPQDNHLSLLLLVRPLPGQPRGAGIPDPPATLQPPSTGFEAQSGMGQAVPAAPGTQPASVLASATVQALPSPTYLWETDLQLAAGIPPHELVIQQAPGTNQLQAWGVWSVEFQQLPEYYRGTDENWWNFGSLYGKWWFDYPLQNAPYYAIYTDLTDVVEWLSGDTTNVEVANNSPSTVAVMGGTLTGVTTVPATDSIDPSASNSGFLILDPVLQGSTITGGRILNFAQVTAGTVSGGTTTAGAPYSGSVPTPSPSPSPSSVDLSEPAFLQGGEVTAGTVTGGALYTLSSPNQSVSRQVLVGPALTGATVQGNLAVGASTLYMPVDGTSGLLTFHPGQGTATITASLLKTPTATAPLNLQGSVASFVTASLTPQNAFTPPSLQQPPQDRYDTLAVTPNYFTYEYEAGNSLLPFFLTAFATGESSADLSTAPGTQWEVWLMTPQGSPIGFPPAETEGVHFQTSLGNTNKLEFDPGFRYVGNLLVRAVNGHREAVAVLNVDIK